MKLISKLFVALGICLLLSALLLALYNVWDSYRAQLASQTVLAQMDYSSPLQSADAEPASEPTQASPAQELPLFQLNPQLPMPEVEIDGRQYVGVLEIPSLFITLPVISEWSYSNLRIAPCRYSGSAYLDNLVIAGHNYASHFSDIRSIQPGEPVYFTDADGNLFSYVVDQIEVLSPTDTDEMTHSDYPLTIFTCTIGGQMRLTIRCKKASA